MLHVLRCELTVRAQQRCTPVLQLVLLGAAGMVHLAGLDLQGNRQLASDSCAALTCLSAICLMPAVSLCCLAGNHTWMRGSDGRLAMVMALALT